MLSNKKKETSQKSQKSRTCRSNEVHQGPAAERAMRRRFTGRLGGIRNRLIELSFFLRRRWVQVHHRLHHIIHFPRYVSQLHAPYRRGPSGTFFIQTKLAVDSPSTGEQLRIKFFSFSFFYFVCFCFDSIQLFEFTLLAVTRWPVSLVRPKTILGSLLVGTFQPVVHPLKTYCNFGFFFGRATPFTASPQSLHHHRQHAYIHTTTLSVSTIICVARTKGVWKKNKKIKKRGGWKGKKKI